MLCMVVIIILQHYCVTNFISLTNLTRKALKMKILNNELQINKIEL